MNALHFDRILIAVDNSETSQNTLAYAKSLISNFKPQVALVTVIPPVVSAPFGADPLLGQASMLSTEIIEDHENSADRLLNHVAETIGAENVEKFKETGSIRDSILDVAKDWDADLILMGTNGRTGLEHFLSGSVAESVIRKSKCPVLVIPISEEDK